MWPPTQFTLAGQRKEIGELVKRESATMCDRMGKKHILKLNSDNWDDDLQTLDVRNPPINANARLWVGPRWNRFPFPLQIMPRRTSTSGRLEIIRIPSTVFNRSQPDSFAPFKLCVTKPIAE